MTKSSNKLFNLFWDVYFFQIIVESSSIVSGEPQTSFVGSVEYHGNVFAHVNKNYFRRLGILVF